MEKFLNKSKNEWEEIGLLNSTPEDRKEKVVNALNIAIKAIIEDSIVSGNNQFETIPIPVIIKIVSSVDVSDEDIPRLSYEIRNEYQNHDFEKDRADFEHMNIDYESMFLSKFAEIKIEEYKNK